MPIYIIRPKTNLLSQSLNLGNIKLNPESRQKQIEQLNRLQQEDKNYQEVSRWTEYIRGKEGITILKSPQEAKISGSSILEMSPEEAENASKDLGEEAEILQDIPLELIEPIEKDTTSFKRERELKNQDLWHLKKVKAITGWKKWFFGLFGKSKETGKNITIAVLDTGIDSTHPALQGKVKAAYTFNRKKWLPELQKPSLDTDAEDNHGTHVAGLICGKKIGVAPQATLISGVLLPNRRGMISNFELAIDWLIDNPEIQIVNISAGVKGYESSWERYLDFLVMTGILPICAIGNEGPNTSRRPGNFRSVFSVGATDRNDRVASFSSSSTLFVDNELYTVPNLVAPGKEIYSSVTGGYKALNGTSMATPIVSGIAALYLEKYPDISVLQLKDELERSCKDLGELRERQGKGLIQINI